VSGSQTSRSLLHRETAAVILKVLTARSVKKLLWQLQELDLIVAQWFNNYCSENPPTGGNDVSFRFKKTRSILPSLPANPPNFYNFPRFTHCSLSHHQNHIINKTQNPAVHPGPFQRQGHRR
jgi:hypothetical protein